MVRTALRSLVPATTLLASSVFVGGLSLEASNTTEIYHYLFLRSTITGIGYIYVTTEEFRTICTYTLGQIPVAPVITFAVQNRQILINSPDFTSAVYGLVGGGLLRAVKVESVNPSTTAIDVPLGLCSVFGDRIAIAQGNIVYFNDPGTEIRTFTGANAVALPATIYDLFQGPGGNLIIGTTDGIYSLSADALGQGQMVFGMLSKASSYACKNYRNLAYVGGQVYGLTKDGVAVIGGESVTSESLTSYGRKRYYSESVGPGPSGDYRNGKLFGLQDELLINVDNKICRFDLKGNYSTWIYNTGSINLSGVCSGRDGNELLVTDSNILEFTGNDEYDGYEITGVACGVLKTEPEESPLIRSVTTSSSNVGQDQKVYLNGTAKTATTPAPTRAENIIGTDTWSATNTYVGHELRSRRHQMAVRTDNVALEIAATGSGNILDGINIERRGKGSRRPTN